MHTGKIVKIKNKQVFIKIQKAAQNCEGCSLSSLCKERVIAVKSSSPSFKEGECVKVEFDWLKFIKYMFFFSRLLTSILLSV